nr:phosphate ABC transporter ATP-binding protein [Neobacillus endophyticus]
MPINAVIRFEHVYYSDGKNPILNDLTGSFHEGKITTLVGPSGAGKTTLFKLCNGLISPDTGQIILKDKPIEDYDPLSLRREVGLALQSATMVSGTVWTNLALPLTLKGEQLPEEKAKELLQMVGLEDKFLNHHVKDLSGGQRQKVSIARTLVNQPKVLLLDEITSSLDRVSQQEIEELIIKINREYSTTIIWITHNLEQAISIGDFSWVMMGGEVIEAGESHILQHPQDERVQRFVRGELD